ncbi:MAG: ATP-binding protein [Candidatus Paracaedibacteraceae bacterium]|nr:ATP-binding protein [Candidatus Paracaedibacteraceae bacterium]
METYKRWQTLAVKNALQYRRVILLAGARQCGKTTLAQDVSTPNSIYRTLDSIQMLEASIADPEGFVAHGNELMIIDEVQRSPLLLQAIKKNVDENKNYGRFLLTGSANIQSLPGVTESLAGRVTNIRLRPLSLGEIHGTPPDFIDRAFEGQFKTTIPQKSYNKDDYLRLAFIGGYPEAHALPAEQAPKWHQDYIKALIERDLKDIVNIRRKDSMYKLLQVLAAWSSKEINIQSIGSTLSIERPTIESYVNALETLYLIDRVKAWASTDYEGTRRKDKLLFSDTGLMTSILRWTLDQVQLDGERNGKLIETFVYQQLISIIEAHDNKYTLYHYRDAAKHEIDFLIENADGDLLGIEIKAGSSVQRSHFKNLEWFKTTVAKNKRFQGIVLYTGQDVLSFGDRMWAVPISSLWA